MLCLQHGHIARRFFVEDIGDRHDHHTAAADRAQLGDGLEDLAALHDDVDRVPVGVLLAHDHPRNGRPLQPGDGGWLKMRSAIASGEVPRILAKMARFSLARRWASKELQQLAGDFERQRVVLQRILLAISAACEGWIRPSASGAGGCRAGSGRRRPGLRSYRRSRWRGGFQRAFGGDQRVRDASALQEAPGQDRVFGGHAQRAAQGLPCARRRSSTSLHVFPAFGHGQVERTAAKAQVVVQHKHLAVFAFALFDHIDAGDAKLYAAVAHADDDIAGRWNSTVSSGRAGMRASYWRGLGL
jgi:hypothetical protein